MSIELAIVIGAFLGFWGGLGLGVVMAGQTTKGLTLRRWKQPGPPPPPNAWIRKGIG